MCCPLLPRPGDAVSTPAVCNARGAEFARVRRQGGGSLSFTNNGPQSISSLSEMCSSGRYVLPPAPLPRADRLVPSPRAPLALFPPLAF
eukprot:3758295-Rhodomonas_salina.1